MRRFFGPSPAARARGRSFSFSATPVGRRGNSKPRSSPARGSSSPPIYRSFFPKIAKRPGNAPSPGANRKSDSSRIAGRGGDRRGGLSRRRLLNRRKKVDDFADD